MGVTFDRFDAVVAFEERAGMIVAFIVCLGVAVENALGQQTGALFAILTDEKMVVVGHQAVGDHAQLQGWQVVLDLAQHKQVVFRFLED